MTALDLFELERHEVEALVESGIEWRMANLLLDICPSGLPSSFYRANHFNEAKQFLARRDIFLKTRCLVFPQLNVLRYRLDFLVACGPYTVPVEDELFEPLVFAVECDGKEHHASVEQWQRDHARDMAVLKETGVPIVRVRGADIWYRTEAVFRGFSRLALAHALRQAHWRWCRDEPDRNRPRLPTRERRLLEGLGHWSGWDWELWATDPETGELESGPLDLPEDETEDHAA